MIKVTLEIDNAIPRSFSCIEAIHREILNSDNIQINDTTFVIPFSWDKSKAMYTIKIKEIEQI